jgi:hypothetical protein
MVSQSAGIDYAKETEAKAIISYLDNNGNWTNRKAKKRAYDYYPYMF